MRFDGRQNDYALVQPEPVAKPVAKPAAAHEDLPTSALIDRACEATDVLELMREIKERHEMTVWLGVNPSLEWMACIGIPLKRMADNHNTPLEAVRAAYVAWLRARDEKPKPDHYDTIIGWATDASSGFRTATQEARRPPTEDEYREYMEMCLRTWQCFGCHAKVDLQDPAQKVRDRAFGGRHVCAECARKHNLTA